MRIKRIVCDKSNNPDLSTEDVIQFSGKLNIDVYLEPDLPVEMVEINQVISHEN